MRYSGDFQKKAADEIRGYQPCPRDVIIGECSASKRMIMDYYDLRSNLRN